MGSLEKAKVTTLKGVGPSVAATLTKLGIETLQDLLFHLPLRYEDRTRITPIGSVTPGSPVVIEGEVVACDVAFGRRRSLLAMVQDQTGTIAIRFFHFSKAQQTNLKSIGRIRCYGEARRGAAGIELYHPEYSQPQGELEGTLTPIYPLTEGITQARLRALIQQCLDRLKQGSALENLDTYENSAAPGAASMDINAALMFLHEPPPDADLHLLQEGGHPAQQRLVLEELVAHQISMKLLKEQTQQFQASAFEVPAEIYKTFLANLPFQLTRAQRSVANQIAADLANNVPMLRLLQGDVGSGKTVIAALAAIQAAESGAQTALMVPTEILAEQHLLNFVEWFEPLGLRVAWLAGRVKGAKRQQVLDEISSGRAHLVVGTHALFQDDVSFDNLGLIIIDEQHKFGVHQRLALKEKALHPHQLVMTATPIPRTLTMSLYADMDCSVIDELPPGRSPITTSVLADSKRSEVVERIHQACRDGAQVYWVCTLIEESEVLQCQAAEVTATNLAEALPGIKLGLVHGRLKPDEKNLVMDAFKAGEIQVLVATTVIEVGVNVPNASLMVIENPERLGLAQLHQLRGRVGRGSIKSYCLLLYHPPLGETAKRRLNVMRESQDGFYIAEQDLQIRGPGEVFGSRQSGAMTFKLADLLRDRELLPRAQEISSTLLRQDRVAAQKMIDRWLNQPDRLSQV